MYATKLLYNKIWTQYFQSTKNNNAGCGVKKHQLNVSLFSLKALPQLHCSQIWEKFFFSGKCFFFNIWIKTRSISLSRNEKKNILNEKKIIFLLSKVIDWWRKTKWYDVILKIFWMLL
jgi:hypothetical protein